MSGEDSVTAFSQPDHDEVVAVARGMATAVAPASGIGAAQAAILRAVTNAVTGYDVDYRTLAPLGPDELATVLVDRDLHYRHRIVHHMVLAEIVLRPLPNEVADRVARYATALGVSDDFVALAHRYAAGTLDLAAFDLRRSGFEDRWGTDRSAPLHTMAPLANPFDDLVDRGLEARWQRFATLDEGTLGRSVWTMYQTRGFQLPGSAGAASPYLAQHDFVHVLADYGTRMECELEVFALIGRADPDPKGFAWLATMIGLFETGYVESQGPFTADVDTPHLQIDGMDVRLADAIRRGKAIAEGYGQDVLEIDYHDLAEQPVDDVRSMLGIPPKSDAAVANGSPGVFDLAGMSDAQRRAGQRA
jgi:hypothetical protein